MYCFSRLLTPEGKELGERNQDALYCIKSWMWECGDIVKKKHISHVLIIWKSSSRIFPKWEGLRSDFIRKERRAYVRRGTQFLSLLITVMCFIPFLCNLRVQWCALRPSVQSFFRLEATDHVVWVFLCTVLYQPNSEGNVHGSVKHLFYVKNTGITDFQLQSLN